MSGDVSDSLPSEALLSGGEDIPYPLVEQASF